MCGYWPTDEFKELSAEEQMNFYRSTEATKESLKKALVDTLTNKRIERQESGRTGAFLPLSVYAERGFDIGPIKELSLPEDREMHPILGETFRVHLHE